MNRFALSATGLMAATASAAPVEINVTLDYWAGEAGITIANSSGTVASLFLNSSSYLSAVGMSFSIAANSGGSFSNGYNLTLSGDFDAGDYTITLTDAYGDGWNWAGVLGGVDGYGGAASGDAIAFTSGSSASGSFTVVPAPAGLALLGLAGLSRRRRD